jgi:hypothetical protein
LPRRSPAAVHTDNPTRSPLLLTMGGRDHTVPEAITKPALSLIFNPFASDAR